MSIRRFIVFLVAASFALASPGIASATSAADVQRGEVVALPAATTDIGGWAKIKRYQETTRLTVRLTGLVPNGQYHGHLHVDLCADLGAHYKDDLDGPSHPPNELHLMTFTAKPNGTAVVQATANWIARPDAQSVFIHEGPAMHGSPKAACAEFPS